MSPIAPGRRNWSFAGSDAGGIRAAATYSLIETAKPHRRDPEAYLRSIIGDGLDRTLTVGLGDRSLWWPANRLARV